MNIFVTVGTTSFDPLVEAVDQGPFGRKSLIQIADGSYLPKQADWFRFEKGIQKRIETADVVVCHAGAGSIFSLLQSGIVPVVVPNTVRRDKHQVEIARWLERKRYAVVVMTASEVNSALQRWPEERQSCVAFMEKRFFLKDAFNDLLRRDIS